MKAASNGPRASAGHASFMATLCSSKLAHKQLGNVECDRQREQTRPEPQRRWDGTIARIENLPGRWIESAACVPGHLAQQEFIRSEIGQLLLLPVQPHLRKRA